MRLYVPATLRELDSIVEGKVSLSPRRAHAATAQLVKLYDAEGITDIEEVEFGAFIAAADDSLMMIAEQPDVVWKRLVISVDVPDNLVQGSEPNDETPLSAVEITGEVLAKVACVHVDEPEASGDIQGVFEGREDAITSLNERDLLWYDFSEIADIPRS